MPFAEDQDMIQAVVPGFCHGDLGDVGRSRIPIAQTRLMKACP